MSRHAYINWKDFRSRDRTACDRHPPAKLRSWWSLTGSLVALVFMAATSNLTIANDKVAADSGIAAVQALSIDVRAVSSGGLWLYGNKEGWLRFVVLGGGVDVQTSQLYIQWFEQSPDDIDPRLLVTKSVRELNSVQHAQGFTGYYVFESPRCLQRVPCSSATLEAFDIRSGESLQFQIDLSGPPGEYGIIKARSDESR